MRLDPGCVHLVHIFIDQSIAGGFADRCRASKMGQAWPPPAQSSDSRASAACRRAAQGRAARRASGERLSGLRGHRQGRRRCRRLLLRPHVPAARDTQGDDRARHRRGRIVEQGRGRIPPRDLRSQGLPWRRRRDRVPPSRRAPARAARRRHRRHGRAAAADERVGPARRRHQARVQIRRASAILRAALRLLHRRARRALLGGVRRPDFGPTHVVAHVGDEPTVRYGRAGSSPSPCPSGWRRSSVPVATTAASSCSGRTRPAVGPGASSPW